MKRMLSITLGALLALSALPREAAAGDLATAPALEPATSAQRAYTRPPAKEGYSYPDCYCTDSNGQRVEVGQLACLQIGQRSVTSRCENASNLTIWRHQHDGCPPPASGV